MKKILCVLIALMQILSCVVAIADEGIDYAINCDFTGAAGKWASGALVTEFTNVDEMKIKPSGSNTKFYQAVIVTQNNDTYLQMSYDSGWQPYNGYMEAFKEFDTSLKGNVNIEFSTYVSAQPRTLNLLGYFTGNQYAQGIASISSDGNIYVFNNKVMPYELKKWYHIAISLNTSTKIATVYINGAEVMQITAGSFVTGGLHTVRFRLMNEDGLGTKRLDDIKVYVNNTFDSEFANKEAYVASEAYKVDSLEGKIFIAGTETKDDFISKIDLQGASYKILNESGQDVTGTTATVEDGMKLTVSSQNGKFARTYSIAKTDLGSDKYTVDFDSKIISNVFKYTTVEAFKANIISDYELKVLKNGAEVTDTYISDDMQLVCNDIPYSIEMNYGPWNSDYENVAVASVPKDAAISQSGTETITNPLTIQENLQKGKALRYYKGSASGTGDVKYEISKFSLAESANLEFSFMAEDNNTKFNIEPKDATDTLWQPGFSIETNGDVYFNNNKIYNVKTNRWYNFVLSFDFPNEEQKDGYVTIYLNGETIMEKTKVSLQKTLGRIRFRLRTGEATSTMWLDDIHAYETGSHKYDADFEGTKCTVSSDIFTVDNVNATIDVYNEENIKYTVGDADFAFLGNIDDSNIALYDSNGQFIDSTDVEIAENMLMVVYSVNGRVIKYYDFIKSVSDDVLTVYDEDFNKKTTLSQGTFYAVANPLEEIGENDTLIVVKYSNNKLISCESVNLNEELTLLFDVDSSVDQVKVFMWDLQNTEPISECLNLQ